MKNLIIFSPNDFGRLLKYYIDTDDSRKVVAFTATKDFVKQSKFCDLDVIPLEELKSIYPPEENDILIGIGNSKMNNNRKKIFEMCKDMGYDIASYIHSSSTVHTNEIGEGNIILERCLIYPFSKIGRGNLLWDNVLITHDCEIGDFNTFASYSNLCGYVKIGSNCFFGRNSILKEHIKIANYTLVGAGSFIDFNTNEYDVAVPAKSYVLKNKKSTDLM